MARNSSAGDIIHSQVMLEIQKRNGYSERKQWTNAPAPQKTSQNNNLCIFPGVPFDHPPRNFFAIPHALALASDLGLLCVADRENGRVQCFSTADGTFRSQYHSGIIGDRLFSVAYAPVNGGQLYVVNGLDHSHPIMGFVINMQSNKVVAKFGPNDGVFENPHDIIVSPDGNEVPIKMSSY